MKHYSANLEQSVTVDQGNLTITAEDQFISQNVTKTGTGRAITLEGANTEFVDGTGAIVSNDAFSGVSFANDILTLTRKDGTTAGTATISTGAFNDTAGRIPIGVAAVAGNPDAYTGTANDFANSSLSQGAADGLVSASAGLAASGGDITAAVGSISATAGNISANAGSIFAGANLQVNGTTTLGDGVGDTITAASLGGTGQGVVLTSAAGVLSRVTTIPEALLPNIAIGDVFTFSTNTDTKNGAEAEFYAATQGVADGNGNTITPTQPYHRGDIAIITYDADDSVGAGAGTSVLLYVGANQSAVGSSVAGDWHDISLSAQGVMDINTTTPDQLTVTDGSTTVLDIVTAPVADAVNGLATGDAVHTFVTSQPLSITGDVATVVSTGNVSLSGDGSLASFAVELQPDVVDLAEINAVQDATPTNDAGKVLTINTAGTGLEWGVNGAGTVSKLTGTFTASASPTIDISTVAGGTAGVANSGGFVTVQVYEVTTGNLSQIIPDSIEINTSTGGAETATITVGVDVSGSVTAYRYVITG